MHSIKLILKNHSSMIANKIIKIFGLNVSSDLNK